jgi:maltooligosyltrehalose trehalohydrolase
VAVAYERRLSVGVEASSGGGVHARVWAPACTAVDLVLDASPSRSWRLDREDDGYFCGAIGELSAGDRYWFRLDGDRLRPDPASRFQPDGPHGSSMVVDPATFPWTDGHWRGVEPVGQVIYEMHVGTFTREGTWRAAAEQLDELARLGITIVEMMPIADFAGRCGWGYDGVDLYAPTRLYGTPDDLRAFIDRAHALGIAVILDVVYNHVGPDGNYLADFSPDYFTDKYTNDWGRALNFEGPRAARAFFAENGAYWIDEFHFDGLRLDATQDIHDASPTHVLTEVIARARAAAPDRRIYVVAENEPQDTAMVRPASVGGHGADALWNDDFHHTAVVALTGRREAYYTDYKGSPQELISCAKYGYLYQGQWYQWQKKRRGTPALDLPPSAFVSYIENHDQIANTPFGRRLHARTSPARVRALTAWMLLGPATPMIFQGQEFAASAPFLFFADHRLELSGAIADGRRAFLSQFPSVTDPSILDALAPPDIHAFERSKIDFADRERHAEWYAFHRDLLDIRRSDPTIRNAARTPFDCAVLSATAFLLRYRPAGGSDRLVLVNLGCDLDLGPAPEPLLAPPWNHRWALQWSSESPAYGGQGTAPLRLHDRVHLPGDAAVLLRAEPGPIDDSESENDER